MSDLVEDIGISSAPLDLRLKFVESQIKWGRRLIDGGAHKPHIRLLLRQAIFYEWERPQMRNYAKEQHWSTEALRYKGSTRRDRRKDLRFDHAIPLNLIVNKLLEDRTLSLTDVLQTKVRATIITLDEDRRLTRAGLQSKMPSGWTWEKGCINARYHTVRIKL